MRFIIIALMLSIISCSQNSTTAEKVTGIDTVQFNIVSNRNEHKVIIIDSCEYIYGWEGGMDGGPMLTHKGNCSNPYHKR